MGHPSVNDFCALLPDEAVVGKWLLEVGSRFVNWRVRPMLEQRGAIYCGVDLEPGQDVDEVCDGVCLVERFGADSFDTVLCLEVLEHAQEWQRVVENIQQVARHWVVITARGPGFPYHPYPVDSWRFTQDVMRRAFEGWTIVRLMDDPQDQAPGVFIMAQKPPGWQFRPITVKALPRR